MCNKNRNNHLQEPSKSKIQQLFIGKSTWHECWSKMFPHLKNYPNMKKWLLDDMKNLDMAELWGCPERVFQYQDLILWLTKGGTLKKGKRQVAAFEAPTPTTLKNTAKASGSKKSTTESELSMFYYKIYITQFYPTSSFYLSKLLCLSN